MRRTAASRSTPGTSARCGSSRRSSPHPAALRLLGRALRRPVRVRGGPPRRGHQPPPAAGEGEFPSPSTSPCSASSGTTGPGASRCCRRSSATSPSSRSSTERTRRRARSSRVTGKERRCLRTAFEGAADWMLTQMVRIREFEERVKSTFEEHGRHPRPHASRGRGEGLDRRLLAALRPDDQLTATYRCHGYRSRSAPTRRR